MGDTPISPATVRIRRAVPGDLPFLAEMGWYAANWRSGADPPSHEGVLAAEDRLAVYLVGWGRAGDAGVVAVRGEVSPVGAAWYRLFTRDGHGYGFVSETIPELSIAVEPGSRRVGVGAALLTGLLRVASDQGHSALSLSVEPDNPALSLYQRFGFRRAGAEGGAWTMLLELA
jgi:ribosomal-protein-alanine N-acetyltransferase